VGSSPQCGGGGFRSNRRLLAMSALMSASAYFRLLPPRPATCSSIAFFTVLLCAALVLEDIYVLPLCAFRSLLGERRSIQGRLPSFCWCRAVSCVRACVRACVHAPFDLSPIA
jgi:hypothetical protein